MGNFLHDLPQHRCAALLLTPGAGSLQWSVLAARASVSSCQHPHSRYCTFSVLLPQPRCCLLTQAVPATCCCPCYQAPATAVTAIATLHSCVSLKRQQHPGWTLVSIAGAGLMPVATMAAMAAMGPMTACLCCCCPCCLLLLLLLPQPARCC